MALRIVDLSKMQRNDWVLRDVSFEVKPGEVVAVYTDNPASGTQLLSLIAGSVASNGGSISNSGFATRFISTKLSREFTFLGFSIRRAATGHSFNVRDIHEASAPGTLFLLDSPFLAAFKSQRLEIGQTLRAVVENGESAVIFTTHDYRDAIEFSDRTIVILDASLEQDAAPQEIYDKPASVAVATSVGRNNLISARRLSSSKKDTPEFVTIEGEHRLFAQRTERSDLGALNKNVTLSIRPEQISISFGASFPEDNLLKASVHSVKPLGPSTRVELDCGGLMLEALVPRLVGLNIGEECMVGLPPDRIAVLLR